MGFVAGHDSALDVTCPVAEQVREVDAATIARAAAFIAASSLLSKHDWTQQGVVSSPADLNARAHLFADTVALNRVPGADLNRFGLAQVLTTRRLAVDDEGIVALRGREGRGTSHRFHLEASSSSRIAAHDDDLSPAPPTRAPTCSSTPAT